MMQDVLARLITELQKQQERLKKGKQAGFDDVALFYLYAYLRTPDQDPDTLWTLMQDASTVETLCTC